MVQPSQVAFEVRGTRRAERPSESLSLRRTFRIPRILSVVCLGTRPTTNMEKLLQLGIVDACRTEAKDHLGRQRVCVPSDMVSEEVRLLKEPHEHGLVFKILVWDICSGSLNVQVVVDNLSNHTPSIAVFLQKG